MSGDESDSDTVSVNSRDTLPEEDTININKLKNSIELYKKSLYDRVIPNDENGPSQTNSAEEIWITIQKNDANILLNNYQDNSELLSKEANEHLKSFFFNPMNTNESINFTSILRLSLITFPNAINLAHILNLNHNKQ